MMVKILAYFVPFAINFLNGGFFFITAHRFAQGGCPRIVVASSLTAWGIAYCLVTMVIGKMVSAGNALRLILSGGVLLVLSSVGFIIFDGLYMQFLWLIVCGCGAALFCTPFQLFAKSIESDGKKASGISAATAFYTMTWSSGFATGPLAFARLSVRNGFLVTLFLALAVTVSVLLIALFSRKKSQKDSEIETPDEVVAAGTIFPEKSYTKLAILGWIVGGLGTVTVCQVRAMWPKIGGELEFSRDHIAYVLATVSYVQALTALLLCRSHSWMWKRVPALLMSCCGIVSLLVFAFGNDLRLFYAAAAVYGIYSGCLYFYLVYHSLAHPRRSGFFVAGNEVIVGVVSMIFPVVGGFLADVFNSTGAAFIFAALVTATALVCQLVMLDPKKLTGEK